MRRLVDPACPTNRLNFSRFTNFERTACMRGVSAKYVVEGEEHYRLDGREYVVRPGQFLLVNHGQEVSVHIASARPVQGICLYVDVEQLKELLPAGSSAEAPSGVYPASGSGLGSWFRAFHRDPMPGECEFEELFIQLSLALAAHIRQARGQREKIEALRPGTRDELHQRILLGLTYLHDHLAEHPVRVRDVARAALMSEYHFLRTFRRCTGKTPMQYLLDLRMEKARRLLGDTRLSVSEVARRCGYPDSAYFSRCFRRYFGHPPSNKRAAY